MLCVFCKRKTTEVPPLEQELKYTREIIFWHEIGHLINRANPCFAIMLENVYRKYKGLPIRYFDNNHTYNSSASISIQKIKNLIL